MCSNQDLASISAALAWITATKPAGHEPHAAALAQVMANGAAARAAMRGNPKRVGSGSGNKPRQWFTVAMGSLWQVQVQGAKAAHDLVTEVLTENRGNGKPPTLNSMQVALSRAGQWWRLVDTDAGQHALEVAKCDAPA